MAAKSKSVGVQTYARVRIFFKDRESMVPAVAVKTAEQTTNQKGLLTVLSSEADSVKTLKTEFTDCFPGAISNEACYDKICVPMINNALKGYKALLIAYGQTGSGKTFSLIGAKGPGQLGLLPRTIKEFCDNDNVLEIKMKGFEAYSTTLTKIPLYDLFDPINLFAFEPFVPPSDDRAKNKAAEYAWVQKKSAAAKALWGSKKGRTGINTLKEGNFRMIEDVEDGFKLVDFAHDNSHFAKTGKNPESSRGHTVYVLILKIKNPQGEDYDPVQTEFVVVDLAGSEGGSTLDALPDGPDKTARFLEGGVINFGLTSLKDMFAEMRKKGKLKASEGNGLRKLLYPFVTSNTMMSIVFTLSPSMSNIMATRATMKFAADACKLKMKPVADTGKKNWEKLYKKLEQQLIEKNNLIKELQEHMNDGAEMHASGAASGGGAASGELYDKFCKMFEAHADRLYGVVHEYGIDSCLSDDVMEAVQKSLKGKKDDYIERLKGVYELHDKKFNVSSLPAVVETQVTKGIGLQNYYEIVAKSFDAKVEKEVRRDTLLSPTAPSAGKRNTGLWMQKAELLREKTANLAMAHDDTMKEMKSTLTEVAEVDEDNLIGETPIAEYGEHAEFEDIDYSAPPKWFEEFDEATKVEYEEKILKAMDDKGKCPQEVIDEIMKDLEIDSTQMDDLRTYMLIKKGAEHDANAVQDFQAELGEGADVGISMMSTEELGEILELKNKVHQLENEKRVERTMKLWGNMRLRIRDRKLKARERQVEDLHLEKTQLSRHLSERTFALEEKKKEIQRAADELSHMKTAFDVLKRQDHETMQAMSDTLTEEKATLEQIKTQLMKEHDELKEANAVMQKEMTELREERVKLQTEVDMARKQLENNEEMEELKEIEHVLAEIRKESKNNIGETTRLLNEMKEDVVGKYEKKISNLQKDSMKRLTEVEKAKNEMMELDFQLKQKDAKITELQNSSAAMDSIRAEYEKVTEELRKAKDSIEGELGAKKDEIEAMRKKVTSLQNEVRTLESAQKSRMERAEERSLDAVHSQEEMQTIIATLREKTQNSLAKEGDLKEQLGLAKGQLESKEVLLQDLKTRYTKAMEDLTTMQGEVKEMNTLRNDLYARDADLSKRNQQVAKLEDKLSDLEDQLSESRRRESTADMMQSSNFDQLKDMLEKTMSKMNNESDIVEKIEEAMKGSDLNKKFEDALRDNGDLKAEIGKLKGELMIKDQQMESMGDRNAPREMAERPVEASARGVDERTVALLQQSIKSLEQQLESTRDRLDKERSEKSILKGRIEEMEQAKAALEGHIKTLQEQLKTRGLEPVSRGGASAVDLERALRDLEDTTVKYHQNLQELGNLKGQLAMSESLLEEEKRKNANAGNSGNLAEKFAELRRDLIDQRKSDDSQHQIFQLQNDIRTLEATIDIKDREVADLRQQLQSKIKETPTNIEVQRELSEKDTQIGQLEDKVLRLQRDLERKEERFNELQDTIAAFDHREADRFEAEQNAQVEIELRRQIQDLQDENARLHHDVSKFGSQYQVSSNSSHVDELRNKAAAANAKVNALEAAIAAKDDEIQRANSEIQKLKLEISGLQNQINYERKKMAEVDKQREERIQNLIEYQCQAIRNQLSAMADSAGLQMTPDFLAPLQRDIKRMSSILSSQHSAPQPRVINGGGVVHMENVDYGKVIADQIAQQRQRVRELEDQAALKNAKINQLQNSMENMKVLHQKEMDEQELAYLLEMRKMREIVRKLRQLSPRVRRLPEIVDLDDGRNSPAGTRSNGTGYARQSNLSPNADRRQPTHSRYKSTDSSRYKTSRSRDRMVA